MINPLLSLLHLSDPTLPIGGFSHSSGLETYVQQGLVKDVRTAGEFIRGMLEINLAYTDAALVSLAWEAGELKDYNALLELDELCSAIKLPKEMRQASQKLGIRLLKIFSELYSNDMTEVYKRDIVAKKADGHYCIAFGLLASVLQISRPECLLGFFYNAAVGMVTNCVKLIPLGQQEGQKLLFSLYELIDCLSVKCLTPDVSLIGVCCPAFDIRSIQHEQLYSRLYMS